MPTVSEAPGWSLSHTIVPLPVRDEVLSLPNGYLKLQTPLHPVPKCTLGLGCDRPVWGNTWSPAEAVVWGNCGTFETVAKLAEITSLKVISTSGSNMSSQLSDSPRCSKLCCRFPPPWTELY